MTPLDFSRVTVAAPLVSLTAAKDQLRITDMTHDAEITELLAAAQEFVIARLQAAADPAWTETTAPRAVRHAIKLMLDALYERRGGDEGAELLVKAIKAIDIYLATYKDPALA